MNDVKVLKIVLVAVFVSAAVFTGFNAYRYSQLNQKVADFTQNMKAIKTTEDAKLVTADFISNTSVPSGAMSTFAKKSEKKKNGDCSFGFFGMCFTHYQNQVDGGADGSDDSFGGGGGFWFDPYNQPYNGTGGGVPIIGDPGTGGGSISNPNGTGSSGSCTRGVSGRLICQ